MESESTVTTGPIPGPRVFVWDIPVRLFHWVLLALMVGLFVSAEILEDAIELHARLGLAALALVLFRIAWGVVGSTYARFTQFLHGPSTVRDYARALLTRRPHFVAGHNPLGGWMVLVLLLVVLAQGMLGLFANDDLLFEGPLAHLVSKEMSDTIGGWHEDLFHGLLILVVLHVAAVIGHKVFKGEDLVTAMFTGYKPLPPGERAENARGGGLLLALTLLAASAAAVYWLVS